MTTEQKQSICASLEAYVAKYGSQNKAAATLSGVSSATISQMLNNNWDKIADDMWRKVAAQVGARQWEAVNTSFYQLFSELLEDARRNSFVYAITAEAGSGKSFTAAHYATQHKNVYHVVCCETWSLQAFLKELLRVLGVGNRANNNDNVAMLTTAIEVLKKQESPLIILDEADKLRGQILYSLITLYNQTEGYCGIVICATSHLERKIMRGVELDKLGFNELFSRFGRKFIKIPACGAQDIAAICNANGVTSPDDIAEVTNDSCGDLRRVKRLIHVVKNRG